jgi:uncharacterized protein (TIGR02147 family)
MELSAMDDSQTQFRILLQAEFTKRCRANARYSIRSFAKHLGMDSSTLSQILAGKRRVSQKMIDRVYQEIGRPRPLNKDRDLDAHSAYNQLQVDAFFMISDWYHFALLDLVQLKKFEADPQWIARKLGITAAEAKIALERLTRLGMLSEKNGRLVKTKAHYTNYEEGLTSDAHKEYQRQIIGKALVAVDQCPQERKDITGMTIVTNSKKLKEAKEKIKKFRRELCAFLEDGQGDSVYHLAMQLYPVTQFDD